MKEEGHYTMATEPASMEFVMTPKKHNLPDLQDTVSTAYNEAK